ncbi:MAG: hypothetical protein HY720_08005 [Planctomycetes bacterium]|nr:hypothetical protein [Planctomycetota bacterium]
MGRHALVLVPFLAFVSAALACEENTTWDRLDSEVVALEFKDAPIGEILNLLDPSQPWPIPWPSSRAQESKWA